MMPPTGRTPGAVQGRAFTAALLALFSLALLPGPAAAQRRYLVEVGGAGAIMSFDNATDLGTGGGGLGRLGVWLPLRFELEGEGSFVKPKVKNTSNSVTVKTFGASLLYNVPIGIKNSAYAKIGLGSTTYGGDCPAVAVPNAGPCGSATALIGGLGFRIGITPTLMIRGEGAINRNSSKDLKFSNFAGNIGVSVMLGSKSLGDADADGVTDADDRCPGTPAGADVDKSGCPLDSDKDGVLDGLDRCPGTPTGVKVDQSGCPLDSDKDGVPDGVDRCPNSPAGAAVDESGCPVDTDKDGVPDGLDRCPDTPRGATVDALGCPSDEDGDGVLDGLDKCPGTPPNTPVDAGGCSAAQSGEQNRRPAPTPPPPAPQPATEPAPPVVLRDNAFALGSARLRTTTYPVLDSLAALMAREPAARLEIGAYTAGTRAEVDSRRMAGLRIEAVRSYLIGKGVRPQRLVPKFYGATSPVSADTSAVGRAVNRRIEIRPAQAGP